MRLQEHAEVKAETSCQAGNTATIEIVDKDRIEQERRYFQHKRCNCSSRSQRCAHDSGIVANRTEQEGAACIIRMIEQGNKKKPEPLF